MNISLTEAYKRRLAVSESVYSKNHENASLSLAQKETIAKVLNNTSEYIKFRMNEAFSNSVGTQRADMGNFKKFTLDVTTVVLPNLIANDLVIVQPMPSFTGSIQYYKFVAGSNKGGIKQGDEFNSPFALAPMTDERMNYTSQAVVDVITIDGEGKAFLAWTPIAIGEDGKPLVLDLVGADSGASIELVDAATGEVAVTGATGVARVKYLYDQVVIPQNDLPIYNVKVERIALEAKPRRIAIYYSQMAAFQAQQENNIDLGKLLQTQAVGELSYEIDTEVVKLLAESAPLDATLHFNKACPTGVSKAEHYEGFSEILEKASQIIYDRTGKHAANYMICASNVKTMLPLMRGWKEANRGKIAGPYFAGTLNGLKVFVSPAIKPGKFVCGFNGDDLATSAAVYAPYMAIVPTALLQFADGGNSQGFSTLYDLKLLNPALLVAGEVVDRPEDQIVYTHEA